MFYDIHPIESTTTLTSAFSTTNGSSTVTITYSTAHGLAPGDILLMDNFTAITNSNYSASDFDDKKFMVTTAPTNTTITITMSSNESGSGATTSGGIRIQKYYTVGPAVQAKGFGYGLGSWGGEDGSAITTTLNGALGDNAFGTGGSGTSITLTSTTNFPDSGTNFILVGTEEISYTGVSGNNLTGITRAVAGTRSDHGSGVGVEYYTGWGEASLASTLTIDPASWSLDNFGEKLIATIKNGKTFELREMYKLINCTIVEFIYFENQILIIDEEGKLNHKPINDIATYLYRKNKKIHDIIVGDALIVDRNQIK